MAVRFAPSPTGLLHLGHAYSALLNQLAARALGVDLLLRFEDLDAGRCRAEYYGAIEQDLAWLGIEWAAPAIKQSARRDAYQRALQRLIALDLVYPCALTRKEVADIGQILAGPQEGSQGADGTIAGAAPLLPRPDDGQCAAILASNIDYAWRLDAERLENLCASANLTFISNNKSISVHPKALGNVILARKDGAYSYHLAVVVDDDAQAISHVIRGADLLASTHVHVALQHVLGLAKPLYVHHGLLRDEDGKRLAKRHDSLSIGHMRDMGLTPPDIRDRIIAQIPDAFSGDLW